MTSTYSGRLRLELHFIVLVLALWPFVCKAAPLQDSADLQHYSEGCYYNYNYYSEGDRILTNEPCLNCTCHNKMLMCYLRVCPFTKPIGHDCTIEKREDQCCPIITCPEEHQGSGSQLGFPQKHGCTVDGKFYAEGVQVPSSPNKPCELCYCIRNRTSCIMQECTLHVSGCQPIYHRGACCPVRYNCDYDTQTEFLLEDESTTTVRPTPGFVLTTTLSPVDSTECVHNGDIYADGALIESDNPCEHCYCMRGDIVCAVQDCEVPMDKQGANCTALPAKKGECCPSTYMCTEMEGPTTVIPFEEKLDKLPEGVTTMQSISFGEESTTLPPLSFEQDLHEGISEEDVQLQQHIDDIPEHVTKISEADKDQGIIQKETATEISPDVGTTQPSVEKVTLKTHTESSTEFEKIEPFLGVTTHAPQIDKESAATAGTYLPPVPPSETTEPSEQGLEGNVEIEGSGYEGLTEVPDIESNEIVPISIPGEGDCLVDEITYRNNTTVPPSNNCDESCTCLSSLVVCRKFKCEDPPKADCVVIDSSTVSCCPVYKCEDMKEIEQVSTEAPGESLTPRLGEKEEEVTKAPLSEGEEFLAQTTEWSLPEKSSTEIDQEVSEEKRPASTEGDITRIPHIPGEIDMGEYMTTVPSDVLKEEEAITVTEFEAEATKSTSFLPTESSIPLRVTDQHISTHPTTVIPTKSKEDVDVEKEGLTPTEYPEEELGTTFKYPALGEPIDKATILPPVVEGTYHRKEETPEESIEMYTTLHPEKEEIDVEMATEKFKPEPTVEEGITPSIHHIEEAPAEGSGDIAEGSGDVAEDSGYSGHTELPDVEEEAVTEHGPKVSLKDILAGVITEQPTTEFEIQGTTQKIHPGDLVTEAEEKVVTTTLKSMITEGEYHGPIEVTTTQAELLPEEIGGVTQKSAEDITGPGVPDLTTEKMPPSEIEDGIKLGTEKLIDEEETDVETSTQATHPEKLPHDLEQEGGVPTKSDQEIGAEQATTKRIELTELPEQVTEFVPTKKEEDLLKSTSKPPISILEVTEMMPVEHKDEIEPEIKVKTDQREEDLFGTTLSEEDLFKDISTKLPEVEAETERIKKIEPTLGIILEESTPTEKIPGISPTEQPTVEGEKVVEEKEPKPVITPESITEESEIPAVGDLIKPTSETDTEEGLVEGHREPEVSISTTQETYPEHEGEEKIPEKTMIDSEGIKYSSTPSSAPTYVTEYPSITEAPEKLPEGVQEPKPSSTRYSETTEKLEPEFEGVESTEKHEISIEPKPSTQIYPERITTPTETVPELETSTKLYAKEEEMKTEKPIKPEYTTEPYFVETPTTIPGKPDRKEETSTSPPGISDLDILESVSEKVPAHKKDELETTPKPEEGKTEKLPESATESTVPTTVSSIPTDVEADKGDEGVKLPPKEEEALKHPEETIERGDKTTERIELSTDLSEIPAATEPGLISLGHGEVSTQPGEIVHGEEVTQSAEGLTESAELSTERGEVHEEASTERSAVSIEPGKVSTDHDEISTEHGEATTEHGEIIREHTEIPITPGKATTERGELSTEHGEVLTEGIEMSTEHVGMPKEEISTEGGEILTQNGKVSTEHDKPPLKHGDILPDQGEESTERGQMPIETGEQITERPGISRDRTEVPIDQEEITTKPGELPPTHIGEVPTKHGEVSTERVEVSVTESTEREQILPEHGVMTSEHAETSTEHVKVEDEHGEVTERGPETIERVEISTERGEMPIEEAELSTERVKVPVEGEEISTERGQMPIEQVEVSTEHVKLPVEGEELSTERGQMPIEQVEVSTEHVKLPVDGDEISTERGQMPVEQAEVSTERVKLPVEGEEISTERGEMPIEEAELSTERVKLPVDGEEISTERGQIPIEQVEVSTEHVKLPVEGEELSTERGQMPIEQAEVSTERVKLPVEGEEISTERGQMPVEQAEVSTEHVKLPVQGEEISTERGQMPVEQAEVSTEHVKLPVQGEELSTERGQMPIEQAEASTEHVKLPVEGEELATERGEIPIEQVEVSTEHIEIPVEQEAISTEHGDLPIKKPEASTEPSEIQVKQGEVSTERVDMPGEPEVSTKLSKIPIDREEASTEHAEISPESLDTSTKRSEIPIERGESAEISTERDIVPPKQGEISTTQRHEESTESIEGAKDSMENEVLKQKEPEIERLPVVPAAEVTTIGGPANQTESTTPAIIREPVDKIENEVVPFEEPEVTEIAPTLSGKPQIPDQSKEDESHLADITERPVNKTVPSDSTSPEPFQKPTRQPPQQPSYGHIPAHYPSYSEDDYAEEEESEVFGPGTCRYGGKLFVSAQQIPRDDPCDFCFCFRSDIICLQQSCPPPISGCHEEPIQGFCCPRYECPVSMATVLNVTTSTTTTSTTLPPHFLHHAYNGAATKNGCHIQGKSYKIGDKIDSASGPCMQCTCGGDGQMKCEPKTCSPEPMLRQMIAVVASRRR